jgi:hypothetical protein
MICKKCNFENETDARFCEKCGADLQKGSDVKVQMPKKNGKKWNIPLLIIGVIGMCVGLFFFVKSIGGYTANESYDIYIPETFHFLQGSDYDNFYKDSNGAILVIRWDTKKSLKKNGFYNLEQWGNMYQNIQNETHLTINKMPAIYCEYMNGTYRPTVYIESKLCYYQICIDMIPDDKQAEYKNLTNKIINSFKSQ